MWAGTPGRLWMLAWLVVVLQCGPLWPVLVREVVAL